ncbi:hypothetical protein T4C_9655 [Trichinella pseudospiralis]|uniref:Uncharacterized protein n=1 Tax=Trichinella pseudospiralis TaxID=6337 RepID=A0A0V1J1N2_TRIPS|nr:hypothetical protein T4C_9655 [Trichinella pseudospiralis]
MHLTIKNLPCSFVRLKKRNGILKKHMIFLLLKKKFKQLEKYLMTNRLERVEMLLRFSDTRKKKGQRTSGLIRELHQGFCGLSLLLDEALFGFSTENKHLEQRQLYDV